MHFPGRLHLSSEVERLQEKYDILSNTFEDSIQEAKKDDLTGLCGRSILEEYLNESCNFTQSGQGTLYTLFIDIDNFKRFNDDFSHAIGDCVIESIADLLKQNFPKKSCLARYGGDEFVVALRGLQFKQALLLSQLLLQRVFAP